MTTGELNASALAYLGDAVFEIMVREKIVTENNMRAGAMNRLAKEYVAAGRQADMYMKLLPYLSRDEHDIIKKGRNINSSAAPKNATTGDYRHATGLEALFGYLYLNKQKERLIELFGICTEKG